MGWLLETAARPWVPLWFCGGLLIDNADRLRRDPADAGNVPARTAASARYRTASRIALTLALSGGGGALGYSIPILAFRWSIIDLFLYSFDQRSRARRPLAPQAGSSVPRSHHGSAQGVPQKNPGQRELAGIDLGFRSGHWVSGPAAAESDAHEAGSQQQQGGRLGYRRRRHAEPLAFPLAQAIGPGVCIVRRAMGNRPFVIAPAEDQACVRNECFGLLKKVARLIVGAIRADRELALPIAQRAASPSRGRGVSARSRLALATLRGSRFGNASNSASAIPASANASRTIRKAGYSSVWWRSAARSPRAPARPSRSASRSTKSSAPSRQPPGFAEHPVHPQPGRPPLRPQIPRIAAPAPGLQRLLRAHQPGARGVQMHGVARRHEVSPAAPVEALRFATPAQEKSAPPMPPVEPRLHPRCAAVGAWPRQRRPGHQSGNRKL